jgi:hypothetical protein
VIELDEDLAPPREQNHPWDTRDMLYLALERALFIYVFGHEIGA